MPNIATKFWGDFEKVVNEEETENSALNKTNDSAAG